MIVTFAVGYGVPLCFVTALLITSHFDERSHYIRFTDGPDSIGDPTLCWIDIDSMVWAFIGPLTIILVLNFIIVVMVVKTAMEASLRSR